MIPLCQSHKNWEHNRNSIQNFGWAKCALNFFSTLMDCSLVEVKVNWTCVSSTEIPPLTTWHWLCLLIQRGGLTIRCAHVKPFTRLHTPLYKHAHKHCCNATYLHWKWGSQSALALWSEHYSIDTCTQQVYLLHFNPQKMRLCVLAGTDDE